MLITGKCGHEGCQADILPAKTQAQYNRNLGLHLRVKHGIIGNSSTPDGRRRQALDRYRRKMGLPPAETAAPAAEAKAEQTREELRAAYKKQYQANYRAMRKLKKAQASAPNGAIDRQAVLKFICPDCGCRVWTTTRPAS